MKLIAPFVIAILIAAIGLADPAHDRVRKVLEAKARQILSEADRVETFRIDGAHKMAKRLIKERLAGFPIISSGPVESKEFAQSFFAVMSDEHTYDDDAPKMCFDPGVAFRAVKGEDSVLVLVCLHCSRVQVLRVQGEQGAPIHDVTAAGKRAFLKLALRAFPEDAELKKEEEHAK